MQLKAINQVHVRAKVYEGVNSLIYRGTRQQDGQPVVLKLLKHDYPTPFQMARHRHEYEIIKSLEAVPGVIQAYGLEQYQKTLVTVLEDFSGVSLRRVLSKHHFSVQEFLPLALRLTQTLEAIHQHQIIHRDINPANIVLNPETGEVKLIDFGLATLLSRQTPALKSLRRLEGTLTYLSPEQTGRMNRAVDYRSDFYSLGATFYELLTGQPPFQTLDPLELLHAHLARQPVPAQQIKSEIPTAISDIMMRLLAKNAEDRYQSAYGIAADLQLCWEKMRTCNRSFTFTVGCYDIPARFQLSQKLYGREAELQQLLTAFERVNEAQGGLVLVSGYAGVGKSALVRELYRPLAQHRGHFITGKFDQYRRDIPYSALLQAFQSLVNQILTESPENIEIWKEQLLQALGANAQVIIDVIPEVQLIVGSQPAVVPLGPTEAQNRFNLVFQNFVQVFTKPAHPLVLFLDDLQWADTASLSLLQSLVALSQSQCLLLIGAYRDHEVSARHPLAQAIADLQQSHAIAQIPLQSLTLHNVQQLLADSLNTDLASVADLAALMIEKTDGNPFFLGQLLHYLYDEGFLQFDVKSRRWQWNIRQIQAVHMTDNVIDLMTHKLQKLPIATQELLTFAACIGNQFELQTLATIREEPLTTVIRHLLEAIQSHVLIPESDAYHLPLNLEGGEAASDLLASDMAITSYQFLHDRVQQAAYTLIPLDERQRLHLKIGRLLLQQGDPGDRKNWLFSVVNQLNQGRALIDDPTERKQLATLNLQAGQQAKTCIAYGPATKCLAIGTELLEANSWTCDYQLTFELHREQFECEYLCGHFEQADALFKVLLEKAQTPLDRAEIYSLQIILCTTLGKFQDVIELGRQGLKQLGWTVPKGLFWVKWTATLELLKIKRRLGKNSIADFIHWPEMQEPFKLAQINLMSHVIPALYYTDMELSACFYLKMASLSLRYGNTPTSAVAYLGLGRFLGEKFHDAHSRYAFGKLAIELVESLECPALKCKTYFLFGGFINHWTRPSQEDIGYLKTAYQAGIEYGDLIWAAYANNVMSMRKLLLGIPLREQEQDIQKHLDYARQVGECYTPYFLKTTQQVIRCLMGQTQDNSFNDESYVEEQQVAFLQSQPSLVGALNWYYVAKATTLYLFERYEAALEMSFAAQQTIGAALGLARTVHHCFYFSLSITAQYAQVGDRDRRHYRKILNKHLRQLKRWAKQGPQNYRHRYWLVVAEMARINKQPMKAQEFYEKTVQWLEEQHPSHQHELALAHELAARFHHAAGRTTIASAYLQNARYHYQQWGAIAKVRALETQYAHLLPLNPTNPVEPLSQHSFNPVAFDLETALRAAQAISDEIHMERLPTKIIQIIIENAGAETGHLLLHQHEDLLIAATATTQERFEVGESTVTAVLPINSRQRLPWSVVHYVARTQIDIVLDDAAQSQQFSQDRYIAQHQIKSLLCVPILKQTQLLGVLYLENNQATAAFTPDRIQLLHVLAAQAAIALENARLYQNAQGEVAELEKLNRLKDDFLSTVSHELRTPMSNIKMATQMLEITLERTGHLAENSPATRYFRVLKEEGEREIGLINDLLDLTRLEAEADPLQLSSLDLQILLPYLAEAFQDRIQAHQQQLQITIDPGLPPLQSDRGYLERIVMELLNNACKYTPEGERILITAVVRDQDIEVSISNTGVEIPEKEKALIFNKFYRIPNNDPWKHGGTGLGLALTQRLVERLGASIRVESGAGQTTFVITFPPTLIASPSSPTADG